MTAFVTLGFAVCCQFEEYQRQQHAKEQARLQWHADAKAKEGKLARARERARRKQMQEEEKRRQQEAEKKAARAAQIREVLRRSAVREEKRELAEYKVSFVAACNVLVFVELFNGLLQAKAEAAAQAEAEALAKERRQKELKKLARQRRKEKAKATHRRGNRG